MLIKLFKYIFYPNWVIIEVFEGVKYNYTQRYYNSFDGVQEKTGDKQNTFIIQYSQSRNTYKLGLIWGHDITSDPAYHTALKRLAELNKSLIK